MAGPTLAPLTRAHLAGLLAWQLAAVLWVLSPSWAWIPLALFLGLMAVGPFVPGWQLFGPCRCRGPGSLPRVCLTVDDGPDPRTTGPLLDLLARHQVRACFFVVGQRALRWPELISRILGDGHELGNHSHTHDIWLMLRSMKRLSAEVEDGQRILAAHGIRPLCFRPPVGIVNPRLWPVLLRQGLRCVGFSRRGWDRGNRRTAGLATRLLRRVGPGDILLLHDCSHETGFAIETWLQEVEQVLLGLSARGLSAVPLSQLLGAPVMERADEGLPDARAAFYDALAGTYDQEQRARGAAPVRRAEIALVNAWLDRLVAPGQRVLEVGAGTGRFTMELLRRGARVMAVDLSGAMLARLRDKAGPMGATALETRRGDIQQVALDGPFDLICAFSSLEYMADLDGTLRRFAALLAPGGHLLCTTAHPSLLRLFVQIGNALRQGLWLHARSARRFRLALEAAGLSPVAESTHVLDRMLLLSVAKRPG